jgi:hypothetical protein
MNSAALRVALFFSLAASAMSFAIEPSTSTCAIAPVKNDPRNWIAAFDSNRRSLVYKLKTGMCTGKVFGSPTGIARGANELLIRRDSRHFVLYDAETMSQKAELLLPFSATTAVLSGNGDRMVAVTSDQTTYLLNTNEAGKAADINLAK